MLPFLSGNRKAVGRLPVRGRGKVNILTDCKNGGGTEKQQKLRAAEFYIIRLGAIVFNVRRKLFCKPPRVRRGLRK